VRELDERGLATAASNILHGREALNGRDVPTEVTVFAHAPRGDHESAGVARTVSNGYLLSQEVTRGRVAVPMPPQPRYLRSEQAKTDEAARQEAARVIAEAMERLRVYRCTVQGHGQSGRIYAPNVMAQVRDDKLGLREDMLLTRCTLVGGRSVGQTTKVELVPLGALSMEPVR
jgi:prophage tail gpP-like protein